MSDSQLHGTIQEIARKVVKDERGDLDVRSTIDASYSTGNPKTLRPGEDAVGAETKKLLMSYGPIFIRPSDSVVEKDINGDTVVIGRLSDAPQGNPTSGAYRLLPVEFPSAVFTVPTQTANQTRVFRFMQPLELKVAKVIFEIPTPSGGTFGAVGVYTADGTVKLIDTGAQSFATGGVIAVTLGAAVTLLPGWYSLAWTTDSGTPTWRSVGQPANFNILNDSTVVKGSAANASSVGVLPSTLGALTSQTFDIPVVKLQS